MSAAQRREEARLELDMVRGVSAARQVALYRMEKGSEAVIRQLRLRREELLRRKEGRRRG